MVKQSSQVKGPRLSSERVKAADAKGQARRRPIARSFKVPRELAALAVEAIARANGADNTAARAAREVVEAGRVRVVLAFHREDGTPLTDADLEALRAFAPPPVGVAERAPGLAKKRSAKKSARASKKRGA